LLSGRTGGRTVDEWPRLPILVCRTQPGMSHPLTRRDVEAMIVLLRPVSIYGVKSVQLRPEPAIRAEGIVFGEYALSGDISLYALPTADWTLPYLLAPGDVAAFRRYGAKLEVDLDRDVTHVHWPPGRLKSYCLYEVLAHELGHHAVQRRRGVAGRAVCRRKDHEALAELYSRRALQATKERTICE